ncbi:MAG: tail protein X [Bacillota bacterium]|jgi:phage tail protein X|nr:tail protein X [Bacillota bacterium]
MSRTYTTVQGDMWDSIAYSQLGSVAHTDKLMNLNTKYRDYYIFPAGITLILPDVDEETADVDTAPPWKQVSG